MSELVIENVSYRYKNADRLALNGVSCAFKPGQVTAVVGPSGSGKTTLLSIMAGLDRPEEGQVLLNGADLSGMDLDAYRRQDVSVIFQAFQLFPLLTVIENVCYPMELNEVALKDAKERARTLLSSVGIQEEKLRRFPANLSGGEQQRVAIARSLATGAGILLADEPTGNLDGENSRNVVEILTRLAHEEGYCVIIVTHDPAIAEASDVVYHMTDGILLQQVI
jgi:ABC-type lipoprotein export system ATPase subunit